jgi:hypothetical protein
MASTLHCLLAVKKIYLKVIYILLLLVTLSNFSTADASTSENPHRNAFCIAAMSSPHRVHVNEEVGPPTARAPKIHHVSEANLFGDKKLHDAFVSDLHSGDTVIVSRIDGTQNTFLLGKQFGGGNSGMTFLLESEGAASMRVVKFSLAENTYRARLNEEIKTHRFLDEHKIENAKVLNYAPSLFVVKNFVPGLTAEDVNTRWSEYSPAEQMERTMAIGRFYGKLKTLKDTTAQQYQIGDLHSGNIIYNPEINEWVIIDPREVQRYDIDETRFRIQQNKSKYEGLWLFRHYMTRELSNLAPAFSVAIDAGNAWVPWYFTFKKATEQVQNGATIGPAVEILQIDAMKEFLDSAADWPPLIRQSYAYLVNQSLENASDSDSFLRIVDLARLATPTFDAIQSYKYFDNYRFFPTSLKFKWRPEEYAKVVARFTESTPGSYLLLHKAKSIADFVRLIPQVRQPSTSIEARKIFKDYLDITSRTSYSPFKADDLSLDELLSFRSIYLENDSETYEKITSYLIYSRVKTAAEFLQVLESDWEKASFDLRRSISNLLNNSYNVFIGLNPTPDDISRAEIMLPTR